MVDRILQLTRRSDLLRLTTAGSVDDGKSTLIGRLLWDSQAIYRDHLAALRRDSRKLSRAEVDLSLLTDGLKAEREQGITIDVAYRHFATPKRRFILADTPGHEQYTRNMVTGASTADLAVLLVDAKLGLLTQSKRHAFLATLLGIRHLVLAVNKMDLVGWSAKVFAQIQDDFVRFVSGLGVRDVLCIPLSALHGQNVVRRGKAMPWYSGPPLLAHLETVDVSSERCRGPFRLPVQHVLRPNGAFRGVCGLVTSGEVRVGDEVLVSPSAGRSRVAGISIGWSERELASAGQSVVLRLEDELDVGRGNLLSHPQGAPTILTAATANVVWMSLTPLRPKRPYLIKHATGLVRGEVTTVRCRIEPDDLSRREAATLALNEVGEVELRLHRPIACDPYGEQRRTGCFIIVDPSSNETVAGGMLLPPNGAAAAGPSAGAVGPEASLVTAAERERILGQRPCTVWLTGLSGSGKSTIARALERRLVDSGHACFVLDGDLVRQGLNRDLGFSPDDRTENIRRVAEVAALMNAAGLLVIAAFISPYAADRQRAAEAVGAARFLEVFVDAPLGVCEARDPKGLYRKARSGSVGQFTGVTAPYEVPEAPCLRLRTAETSVDACAALALEYLSSRGYI